MSSDAFPSKPLEATGSLWDYASVLYRQDGVAIACLSLQDEHGADVLELMTALFVAARGRALTATRLQELRTASAPWRQSVVLPLRTLRRDMKALPDGPMLAALFASHPSAATLRERIKGLELEAERAQLALFERLAAAWPADAQPENPSRAAGNLRAVIRKDAVIPTLATLLRAAYPTLGTVEAQDALRAAEHIACGQ